MITLDAADDCAWCGCPLPPGGPSPDFCTETHQHLWCEAHRTGALTPAQWGELFDYAAGLLSAAAAELVPTFKAVGEAATAAIESLRRAGVLERPPAQDRMQRALELRRTRNTGPALSRRPPRRIDATRARR